jgi:hypothetical protein
MAELTRREIATRTASVIGGIALACNAAFYFLSQMYFDSHAVVAPGVGEIVDTEALGKARIAFALLSVLVSFTAYGAAFAPKIVGHVTSVVLGLGALYAAYASFDHHMPAVMTGVLTAVGVLLPTLAHFSWRGSRPAWAFLMALVLVFGIVTFFGAPKVRNVLHVGFWTAMILPGVQFVALSALAMLRGDYRAAA